MISLNLYKDFSSNFSTLGKFSRIFSFFFTKNRSTRVFRSTDRWRFSLKDQRNVFFRLCDFFPSIYVTIILRRFVQIFECMMKVFLNSIYRNFQYTSRWKSDFHLNICMFKFLPDKILKYRFHRAIAKFSQIFSTWSFQVAHQKVWIGFGLVNILEDVSIQKNKI